MLAIERQREILRVLSEQTSVRVPDLAVRFQVAEETIRRDLDKLSAEGRLVRSHGGAVAALESEQPHEQRELLNQPQKEAMAREAVRMIEPGDTIALDASSSSWFIARQLPDMPLTVITNSVYVCTALAGREQVSVICTGGSLTRTSMSLVGTATIGFLGRYHASKLFFSCRALDLQRGLSDISEEQAAVRQAMLDISERHILLMDSSKWGARALSIVAPLQEVHCIITDINTSEESCQSLREAGIEVVIAP
jgi:DeoR/GlpR family transcriptional regulator of sugar metabolism